MDKTGVKLAVVVLSISSTGPGMFGVDSRETLEDPGDSKGYPPLGFDCVVMFECMCMCIVW